MKLKYDENTASIEVAPIGFGCCPMGRHGWGRVEEDELIAAVHTALDLGVRIFDTADIYGLGVSEVTLGKALRGKRADAVVATKFGVRFANGRSVYDTSVQWINEALTNSLRRLEMEHIDLYQMHYWDGITPLEDIVGALESLKLSGKIRAYGVTNFDPREIARIGGHTSSFSYQYSLVDRAHEKVIMEAQRELGTTFFSWGTLSQGLLSGNFTRVDLLEDGDRRRREVYANFHGARFQAIKGVLAEMAAVCTELGVGSLTQMALRWVIDRVSGGAPLIGIKRPEQIRDAAGALNFKLDAGVLTRLDTASNSLMGIP